jgi:hypothetical protein
MSDSSGHTKSRQTYLVTLDAEEKISSFKTVGINTPSADDNFYRQIQQDLVDSIQEALGPDVKIETVRMSELSREVLGLAYSKCKTNESLIVSTCHEFAEPMKGITLDINRLVDVHGNTIGIGPRPGCDSIADQIKMIKYHASGKPVVLVEDGIFSGGTVQFVVESLKKEGVLVSHVVVGFVFPSSQANIDRLNSIGVEVSWLQEFEELLDWVPDHDFFPLVPNCGKVIGVAPFGLPTPFYSFEKLAYSIPYVYPFAPVESWASIPDTSKRELARKCIALSQQIYTKINILNDRKIKIKEVAAAPQPVTIPVLIGQSEMVKDADKFASEFLNDLSHSVATKLYSS